MQRITNDLFGIASRLRSINSKYCLFFNQSKKRYEVHYGCTPTFFSLCFLVPHLDARCIAHANKTRIENFDKINTEIDVNNAKITQKPINDFRNTTASQLADFLQYSNSKESEVNFKNTLEWH